VDVSEIRKTAELEDRHWWFRERRHLLAAELERVGGPGRAIDVGAAGGGNTRVLRDHGWSATAIEYSQEGAALAWERSLFSVRGDATALPLASGSIDLAVAFDVLEHIEDDKTAVAEIARVLRRGGTFLVSVPCDMRLWGAHDVACSHFRRYTRETLQQVVEGAGFQIEALSSWNVLLRPVVRLRRRRSEGSDTQDSGALLNFGLSAVIRAERYLPVKKLPGVSLMLRASRL
jgi:SAM-dependent methyltransferase